MSDANDEYKANKQKKGKGDEKLRDAAFKKTERYIQKSIDFRIEMEKMTNAMVTLQNNLK